MAQISRSVATLRIMGDDLLPSKISEKVNCRATYEQTKDEIIVNKNSGRERKAMSGMWRLEATEHEPENLNSQIDEIVSKMTADLSVWEELSKKYHIDLFCGIFMENSNEGMEISPHALTLLADRGIQLSMDIYDGKDNSCNTLPG